METQKPAIRQQRTAILLFVISVVLHVTKLLSRPPWFPELEYLIMLAFVLVLSASAILMTRGFVCGRQEELPTGFGNTGFFVFLLLSLLVTLNPVIVLVGIFMLFVIALTEPFWFESPWRGATLFTKEAALQPKRAVLEKERAASEAKKQMFTPWHSAAIGLAIVFFPLVLLVPGSHSRAVFAFLDVALFVLLSLGFVSRRASRNNLNLGVKRSLYLLLIINFPLYIDLLLGLIAMAYKTGNG